jgi:hypothetical protein
MLQLQAEGLDVCPIRILMELAAGKTTSGEPLSVSQVVKLKAASELCSYLYPRRKAVEIETPTLRCTELRSAIFLHISIESKAW